MRTPSSSIVVLCALAAAAQACFVRSAEPAAAQQPEAMTPAAGKTLPSLGPDADCGENFKAFDRNDDERVSKKEFTALPHAHGGPMDVFDERDADGNGALTQVEFCSRFGERPASAVPPRPTQPEEMPEP